VGLAKIRMTPFDWPNPQTPSLVQNSGTHQMRAELLWFLCGSFQIFVTMATGVGLTQISLTQFNQQTSKTPYLAQESWWYLIHKLIY